MLEREKAACAARWLVLSFQSVYGWLNMIIETMFAETDKIATRRQNFYVSGTETVDAEECACFVSGSDSQV